MNSLHVRTVNTELNEFQIALGRLVDRLGRLPERHWVAGYEVAAVAVQQLRKLTLALGDSGPVEVPRIAARAAGAQLAVIGADFLASVQRCQDDVKVASATQRALVAVKSATSALP